MTQSPPKSLSLSAWQAIAASAGTLRRISVPVEHQPEDETAYPIILSDGIRFATEPNAVFAPFAVGDRIALKERWLRDSRDDGEVIYEATPEYGMIRQYRRLVRSTSFDGGPLPTREEAKWSLALNPFWSSQPADSMPLWAVRHFAVVRAVTPYRVRDITHEQALAEGCKGYGWVASSPYFAGPHTDDGELPVDEFKHLWIQRHGRRFPFDTAWAWGVEVDVERVTRTESKGA